MCYKDKIYDILDKKFSSHKGYISLKELDLNANYDDRFGKWTETNIIGFVYRSKTHDNVIHSFSGKLVLNFYKMRCEEQSYQKSVSQIWFKKLDREFENELAVAVLIYYILDLKLEIDFDAKPLVKFINKNSKQLEIIYNELENRDLAEKFLSQETKDIFLF